MDEINMDVGGRKVVGIRIMTYAVFEDGSEILLSNQVRTPAEMKALSDAIPPDKKEQFVADGDKASA